MAIYVRPYNEAEREWLILGAFSPLYGRIRSLNFADQGDIVIRELRSAWDPAILLSNLLKESAHNKGNNLL